MLSTTLSPSYGDAFICGLSVRHDRQAVRKLLGVCPQFDLYWERLTGAEHIRIFAALKGLSREQRDAEVRARLEDVDLTSKEDVYAGEYSGGMQRRLSVALSLTGDPKIVLLDECTSGADPLVRRDLWGTIQRAKEGRVVFLITHSIDEAQHIAGHNLIGIMAKGKLRVLGKSMHLKRKFGAGHSISINLNGVAYASSLAEAIFNACPGATLASSTPGMSGDVRATYNLPASASDTEVLSIMELLEHHGETYGILNYSINSTSLGEVFKSITSLSEDVAEKGDDREEIRENLVSP